MGCWAAKRQLFKQTLKILQQISEKMFVLIHESAQNCENNERYFQANLYFRTVYFILKWPIIAISAKGEI